MSTTVIQFAGFQLMIVLSATTYLYTMIVADVGSHVQSAGVGDPGRNYRFQSYLGLMKKNFRSCHAGIAASAYAHALGRCGRFRNNMSTASYHALQPLEAMVEIGVNLLNIRNWLEHRYRISRNVVVVRMVFGESFLQIRRHKFCY
jgi:hypothetical protein